jgi:YidC/Oxa1 family membrane protein insertase
MMKLYREKGVNPANVLGCLPMFLQTPIWIALYAMLYFAIELRHEPAFWGFFQWVSGGAWGFLNDLSSQDNFIQVFDEPHKINVLISTVEFQSINIIPLLMGVVFYFQQKLTTPPAANEQQAQQQKMMKIMILLFPVFLYFAPAGLNLYILASTGAGIVDSYIVRKHIKEQEASGELFKPKPVKPGGLRDRIAKAVEAKQQQIAQQQKQNRNPRKR